MLHRQLARPLAVDLPHQPTSVCECVCFFFLVSARAQLPHSTRQLLGRLALILFSASHIRGTGWLETGGMQNISAPTAGIPPRECSRSQWSLFSHRSPVRQLYETRPVHQPFGLTTCVLFCLRDTFFFFLLTRRLRTCTHPLPRFPPLLITLPHIAALSSSSDVQSRLSLLGVRRPGTAD